MLHIDNDLTFSLTIILESHRIEPSPAEGALQH